MATKIIETLGKWRGGFIISSSICKTTLKCRIDTGSGFFNHQMLLCFGFDSIFQYLAWSYSVRFMMKNFAANKNDHFDSQKLKFLPCKAYAVHVSVCPSHWCVLSLLKFEYRRFLFSGIMLNLYGSFIMGGLQNIRILAWRCHYIIQFTRKKQRYY